MRLLRLLRGIPKGVLLIILLAWVITPVYFLLATSFTKQGVYLHGFQLPPIFSLENYQLIFAGQSSIWLPLINSTIVTVATTVLALALAAPAAWALSHYRNGRWGRFLYLSFYVLRGIPPVALVLPFYIIFSRLHLLNSIVGIIIGLTPLALPYCVWMLRVTFDSIPAEVEEAASVDGAGLWRTFVQVVLPIAAPSIAAAGILSALFTYVDFMVVTTLAGPATETFPLYVTTFQQDFVSLVGPIAAASIIGMIPMLLLFGFSQRFMKRLATAGIH